MIGANYLDFLQYEILRRFWQKNQSILKVYPLRSVEKFRSSEYEVKMEKSGSMGYRS